MALGAGTVSGVVLTWRNFSLVGLGDEVLEAPGRKRSWLRTADERG
jgi:hypothetical protein